MKSVISLPYSAPGSKSAWPMMPSVFAAVKAPRDVQQRILYSPILLSIAAGKTVQKGGLS